MVMMVIGKHIHPSDEAVYRLAKILFDKGLLTFDDVVSDVFKLYDLSEENCDYL